MPEERRLIDRLDEAYMKFTLALQQAKNDTDLALQELSRNTQRENPARLEVNDRGGLSGGRVGTQFKQKTFQED